MKEYLSLGPTPSGEDCAQVGSENYIERARKECKAFKEQLIRTFGEPPFGAGFRIKSNPHDFGSYLDVEVYYNEEIEEAVEYALNVENKTPVDWDDEAKKSLSVYFLRENI